MRRSARNGLWALVVLCCAGLVLQGIGGPARVWGVPALFVLMLVGIIAAAGRRRIRALLPSVSEPPDSNALPRQSRQTVTGMIGSMHMKVLGAQYCRQQWMETETGVDAILDRYIDLIEERIDAHTVAVLFPTLDGGFKLRRYRSRCDCINEQAVIYPGVGVLGSFLKDGLKQLTLQDIVSDSMTLYYYTRDAGIRSLMATPIVVEGVERGIVIVDSTEKNHFSNEDHARLSSIAWLLGQTVYCTYLFREHNLEHLRLAAMSSIEKYFFRHLSLDAILDKVIEIIPFAIDCDRVTMSLRAGDDVEIVRAWGAHTDGLRGRRFPIGNRTLVALIYAKNISLTRDFSSDHEEIRYGDNEPRFEEAASFLGVPVGVDGCKGVIFIESRTPSAFSDATRDLLLRLATSAALAIEKVRIIERANNLATRDGLTGLMNHRQFQAMLNDEITRAIRYNDPLSLVLCDIDYFKKVNDSWGHPFGDTVLKGVADTLQGSIREGIDMAARYGGEEFALILVKTDARGAAETADRIRQAIADLPFTAPTGEEVRATMSFGVAGYREHAKKITALIKNADKALYRAKENGRNRVDIY